MNEVISTNQFDFEGNDVRIQTLDGEPWFVATDVCRVLEHTNVSVALKRLDDDERDALNIRDPQGRPQKTNVINESGLYSLILTSRTPAGKRFKKWVTSEVLPSIRKTGGYGKPEVNLRDPIQLTDVALQLIDMNKELKSLLAEAAPKASFYDKFVNADGLYGLQNAGRALQQGPNKFVKMLKQGYLFYQGGALVPKARWRDMGLFEVRCALVDESARYQTYVTPKGLQYFARKLDLPDSVTDISLAGVS